MAVYKYTYQDWVEGKIKTSELMDLYYEQELSSLDLSKIENAQYSAFKDMIDLEVIWEVHRFLNDYGETFAKSSLLERTIEFTQRAIDDYKLNNHQMYLDVLKGFDGRQDLTYSDVEHIYKGPSGYTAVNGTPAYLLVKLDLLQWLIWFQQKEKEKTFELNEKIYQSADAWTATKWTSGPKEENPKESSTKLKLYSWKSLFKDSRQADKILIWVNEFLSGTGQWIAEPKGRHLVALFLELRDKGYFKSDRALSNPMMAIAFNMQFGTSLRPENFQAKKSEKAEGYREHFKHIPPYNPNTK